MSDNLREIYGPGESSVAIAARAARDAAREAAEQVEEVVESIPATISEQVATQIDPKVAEAAGSAAGALGYRNQAEQFRNEAGASAVTGLVAAAPGMTPAKSPPNALTALLYDPVLGQTQTMRMAELRADQYLHHVVFSESATRDNIWLLDPDGPGIYVRLTGVPYTVDCSIGRLAGELEGSPNIKIIATRPGSTAILDPGPQQKINYQSMVVGERLQIANGEVALIWPVNNASEIGIALISSEDTSQATRILVSSAGDYAVDAANLWPKAIHYINSTPVNVVLPTTPQNYRPMRFVSNNQAFTLDPGANRRIDNLPVGQKLTVPVAGTIEVVLINSDKFATFSRPSAGGSGVPTRTILTVDAPTIADDATYPAVMNYVTTAITVLAPANPVLYQDYELVTAGANVLLSPGTGKSFQGYANDQALPVTARGAIRFRAISASQFAVVSRESRRQRVQVSATGDYQVGDEAVAPDWEHYVTAAANILMPVVPHQFEDYVVSSIAAGATIDPGSGRTINGLAAGAKFSIPRYATVTITFQSATSMNVAVQNGPLVPPPEFASAYYYGDGGDGDVTISTGTTTLGSDMQYNNLTISGTGKLDTNGYRVFVAGVLDLSAAAAGAISRNGSNGASGSTTATTALAAQTLGGAAAGSAGGAGGATTGTAGAAAAGAQVVSGGDAGAAGAGGNGSSGNGGAAGSVGARTAFPFARRYEPNVIRGVALPTGGQSSSGGGGGGGDGTAGGTGGASGTGGGIVWLSARTIALGANTTAGLIQANGGNGGDGAAAAAGNRGGGGGGGAGGGGMIYLTFGQITGGPVTGALQSNGGKGGDGGAATGTGTAGSGGAGGQGGRVITGNLSTNTWTNSRAGAGSAASGQTGGAGGTNGVNL